jgi:hypothetical protein
MVFALACLALTLFAAPAALAGGWAVTTLDTLPRPLHAGETYTVGYTIRQHGQTPYVGANSAIELRSPSGELTRFKGVPAGAAGHYVAEVRFDAPGEWQWTVDQSPFAPQALGTIGIESVATEPPVVPIGVAAPVPGAMQMAALVLLAAGVALFGRRVVSGSRRAE